MKTLLPPTYFFAGLLLIGLLHWLLPLAEVISGPWRLLGLLAVGLGIHLNLSADAAFKRCGTTVKPFQRSAALIVDGVFGFSRNPMYLGMVLVLAGLAWIAGSISPWLVPLLFALLMDRLFIMPEERLLAETFPDDFARYRQRARRWL